MTAPVPVACPKAVDTEAPRKRRRRAPASGAADDCFACSKRNVKCDRRRPYCSQCLEVGSDCSGYKTQLTWGVGVASRGKLRGLSLPIAKSAPATRSPPKTYRQRSATTNKIVRKQEDVQVKLEGETIIPSPYTSYDFVNMNPKSPQSPAPSDWSQSEETVPVSTGGHSHLLRQSLHRLQPPQMRYGDDFMSSSAGSLSAYSDTDYSPIAQSFDDAQYMSPIAYEYSASPEHTYGTSADMRGPTSCPDQFYPGLRPVHSHQSFDAPSPSLRLTDSDYDDDFVGSHMSNSDFVQINKWDIDEIQSPLSTVPPSINFNMAPDVSPRLSFYLNYYEKIICPITVAIDSPCNPYRQSILGLAVESQSLQHAICALASCNLRTRRKQSLGQWSGETELQGIDAPLDDSSIQEEYFHRSQAVSLLNAQLSNPTLAKHDSVLATLLMLCHYRMCETGIAQFKTQFAGVKKLLGMREAAGIRNWGWMESKFHFFDAITASVNDREAQLGGFFDSMGAYDTTTPLENLAGCDGRLFKAISKLGRLNMLSRDRPVEDLRAMPPQPLLSPLSINTPTNGFYEAFPSSPSEPMNTSPPAASQAQFWEEWRNVRQALQSWTYTPATLSLPVVPTPAQVRDFGYVSEAFRHAALLYTERLAAPGLPSTDLRIQQHVSQVLFYVTSLGGEMGKFLLWPMFIAGSEAVGEVERGVVRDRCRSISRRGGYANNLAGLDILERVWAEGNQRGFGWEKWMRGVEGEFIMV